MANIDLCLLVFFVFVQGRVVSFKNAIIILTSNLGSAEIFNAAYKQKKEGGQLAGMCTKQTWRALEMLL
jgi:ATP-dependent Clp protease ATP-binding subunit ClpA